MPRGKSRRNDIYVYKRLMSRHKLIGLLKSQPLTTAVDCTTMLTSSPSYPMAWEQINSLLMILEKLHLGIEIDKKDLDAAEKHLHILAAVWQYMTEECPQKGIINARLARKPEREDGEGSDESTNTGTSVS